MIGLLPQSGMRLRRTFFFIMRIMSILLSRSPFNGSYVNYARGLLSYSEHEKVTQYFDLTPKYPFSRKEMYLSLPMMR